MNEINCISYLVRSLDEWDWCSVGSGLCEVYNIRREQSLWVSVVYKCIETGNTQRKNSIANCRAVDGSVGLSDALMSR